MNDGKETGRPGDERGRGSNGKKRRPRAGQEAVASAKEADSQRGGEGALGREEGRSEVLRQRRRRNDNSHNGSPAGGQS